MQEWVVNVETSDGPMPTFMVRPAAAKPYPVIAFYMDALGIREELRVMARRIAAAGYYVVLPNLFYRAGGPSFDASALPTRIDPRMEALNVETSMAMVAADTRALVSWLDDDDAAANERVGAIGFCMGGRHAITAAANLPHIVRTAVSIHGGRLVSAAPDSAHRRLAEVRGEVYIAFADQDPSAPGEHLEIVRRELECHEVRGVTQLHAGALHGFAFPERYCYHKVAAELCWRHCFALFERNLCGGSAALGGTERLPR